MNVHRKKPAYNNIYRYLQKLGLDKNISEFAEMCGIPRSSMDRYVYEDSVPSVTNAIIIAKNCGCTVEDLFDKPFNFHQ